MAGGDWNTRGPRTAGCWEGGTVSRVERRLGGAWHRELDNSLELESLRVLTGNNLARDIILEL